MRGEKWFVIIYSEHVFFLFSEITILGISLSLFILFTAHMQQGKDYIAECECGRLLKPGWQCDQCRKSCPYCRRALTVDPNDYCDRCFAKCSIHGLFPITQQQHHHHHHYYNTSSFPPTPPLLPRPIIQCPSCNPSL